MTHSRVAPPNAASKFFLWQTPIRNNKKLTL
jgi:hypothetical protein